MQELCVDGYNCENLVRSACRLNLISYLNLVKYWTCRYKHFDNATEESLARVPRTWEERIKRREAEATKAEYLEKLEEWRIGTEACSNITAYLSHPGFWNVKVQPYLKRYQHFRCVFCLIHFQALILNHLGFDLRGFNLLRKLWPNDDIENDIKLRHVLQVVEPGLYYYKHCQRHNEPDG